MNNDDAIRLMHMLDAAREAVGFFKGIEKRQLQENRMLLLATVKELEIVGDIPPLITLLDNLLGKSVQSIQTST